MRFRTRLLAVTAAALGLVAVFTAAPARAYTPQYNTNTLSGIYLCEYIYRLNLF